MKASSAVLLLVFAVVMVVIGPIAAIWALNTLFPVLNIPLNGGTWLAGAILLALLRTSITRKD